MLARLVATLCCGRSARAPPPGDAAAEIERLTRLLAAEREEKEREREEKEREREEKERERKEKEREHMRAERLAKDHFFACMRGMSSSSAADGASGSDMWRRGAPTPNTVSLDALLPGLSGAGGPAECAAAWAAGCSSARELPRPAPHPRARSRPCTSSCCRVDSLDSK
jgi:hypothetical protein